MGLIAVEAAKQVREMPMGQRSHSVNIRIGDAHDFHGHRTGECRWVCLLHVCAPRNSWMTPLYWDVVALVEITLTFPTSQVSVYSSGHYPSVPIQAGGDK
jgi:hypothetical protein